MLSLTVKFSKIVTARTDRSWELCRQFCYAMVEGDEGSLYTRELSAGRLTEGLFCHRVVSIPIRHIGI